MPGFYIIGTSVMKELTQTYKAKIRHTLQLLDSWDLKEKNLKNNETLALRSLEFLDNFVLDFEMYEEHQQERVN